MFVQQIRQAVLRCPVRLPGGFNKPRGAIGGFFYACFFAVLARVRGGTVFKPSKKGHFSEKQKKGVKTHCLSGLYAQNFKIEKNEKGQTCGGVPLSLPVLICGNRVIGNRYAKNTPKHAPSLVTDGLKGGF